MSAVTAMASSPRSAAAAFTASSLRDRRTTRAPAAISSAAMARPIPRLAPPTTYVFPLRSMGRAAYSRTVGAVDRLTWRSALARVALALALFALLGYLAVRLVPGAGERLSHASPGWIAACVALELVACAGFAACFWACFSYAPHFVSRTRSAQVALGELAAFAIVPTGVAAPLLRFWVLRRGGMPLRTIGVRSVVHGPLLNVPYVAAALVLGAGVLAGIGPGHAPVAVALAPIGVVLVTVAIAWG